MKVKIIKNKYSIHKWAILSLLILIQPLLTTNVFADSFSKGSKFFSFGYTQASSFGSTYSVYSIGAGYYFIDGFEAAFTYTSWQGGLLDITEYSPSLRYVFRTKTKIDPYVGIFYQKTEIEKLSNLDAYGARYGVYITTGRESYVGLGGVYIGYQNCSDIIYTSCSNSYVEISGGFSF